MTAVTTLPYGRPLTRADLATLPDDGHRYELIDGVLIVSPSPVPRHQRAVLRLAMLLQSGCPAAAEVFVAPLAAALADDTEVQPDVLVAPVDRLTSRELDGPPTLAVEVLSPSTRRVDLLLKRDRLQAAGVPSYWLVDPDEPSITVLELRDGAYAEVVVVRGDEETDVELPWPVTLRPASFVAPPP